MFKKYRNKGYLAYDDIVEQGLTPAQKWKIASGIAIAVVVLTATLVGISAVRRANLARQEEVRLEKARTALDNTSITVPEWVDSQVKVNEDAYKFIVANPDIRTVERYAQAIVAVNSDKSRKYAYEIIPWANDTATGFIGQPWKSTGYYNRPKRIKLLTSGKSYGNAQEEFYYLFDTTWVSDTGAEYPVYEVVRILMSEGRVNSFTHQLSRSESND